MSSAKPAKVDEEYHYKHTETQVPGAAIHSFQSETRLPGEAPVRRSQTVVSPTTDAGYSNWGFRRAPIEEASIPQPRPPPDHDSLNEPTLMTKIVQKLDNLGAGAFKATDKVVERVEHLGESAVNTVRHTKDNVKEGLEHTKERIEGSADRAKMDAENAAHKARAELHKEWEKIKPHHHVDSVTTKDLNKEFVEGADMAKSEANSRFDNLAAETRHKLQDAEGAVSRWEHEGREQVRDAWESAKTHTEHLFKRYEAHPHPSFRNLDDALKHIRADNLAMQQEFARDVCERHAQRAQCYKSVEKIMEIARENTKINMSLAVKDK